MALSTGLSKTLATEVHEWSEALLNPTSPPGCHEYLREHALARGDLIEKYQIGYTERPVPRTGEISTCLTIPYLTPFKRKVITVKYRCVQDHDHKEHGGKFISTSGVTTRMFNTQAYFDASGTIGLAEGEFDAICATEYLRVPTMGYPGAQQWKSHGDHWEVALRDFDRVLIFADGDEPGVECARSVAADIGDRASVIRCRDGMDVSSSCLDDSDLQTLKGRIGKVT